MNLTSDNLPAEGALLPLDDVRILDLSGRIGQYATRLLADLGADVIRVEPPGGSEARREPPFYHDLPDLEKSLAFWYFNANKRSITLDLATADGREIFGRLLQHADIVVDGLPLGTLKGYGFSEDAWRDRLPQLIWAEVSGFGSWGPHAAFLATDLVGLAMSGVLTLSGYPDRPPTMLPGHQGYLSASIEAAQGIMLALLARDLSGEGQTVEISMQEALSMAQETAMQTVDLRNEVRRRQGDVHFFPGVGTYPCADGYVYAMVGVPGFGAPWSVLAQWMDSMGEAGDLMDPEWQSLLGGANLREMTRLMADPAALAETARRFQHVDGILRAFMQNHTKAELYEQGQRRRLLIGPVNSVRDLLEDSQLQARGWYSEVPLPGTTGSAIYPGPPFRFSLIPWAIRRPPPQRGEHNREIYMGVLGLTSEQLQILSGAGVI